MLRGRRKADDKAMSGLLSYLRMGYDMSMSTVQEIEAAIERLPAAEREAFESRVVARRCGLDALGRDEYRELIASLDEAELEIDAGRGVSGDDLRRKLPPWARK